VISRADEQKILDQYVALLEDARERLRKKEEGIESIRSEVANLEAIVNGVSSRIPGVTGDAASSGIA
jgi:predicted  nucleic acid-binding Zn-ribbon protein